MKKLLLLVISFLIASQSASSQPKVDSLLQLFNKAPENHKTNLLLELSFNTRKDTAKSNLYTRQALKLAERLKQLPEQAKAIYYFGETHYFSNDFSKAIPYYEKSIPLFEQLKDTFQLTNCYNSVGLCYHTLSQGENAIKNLIQALKLAEKNREYTAEILGNIAMAHSKMGNNRHAINFFKKAVAINQSIGDSISLAINYNGIGQAYSNMHKPDSSIIYFSHARHLFKKTYKLNYEGIALANLAAQYIEYPDSLEKAMKCLNQAQNMFQKLGIEQYQADILQTTGKALIRQNKLTKAIEAFNESLQLSEKFKLGFPLKVANYSDLSEAYEKQGNYKLALKYQILNKQYTDSLVQKEKYQEIINLEKQYETEKKQNEIIRLQARQELTDVQLRKNKQLKILGFVTASLMLIFVLFVLIRYYDKHKLNQLLELKNKKIEQSENELRALNASKNKFFSIIAHDLKNPFHTVMGYSWLLSKDYDKFTEEERRKFASDIHHSTNNIFRLLQNLLEWSRSQTGRLVFIPREIEFKQILENSVNVLRSLADHKNIVLSFEYNDDLVLFADPLMIETVLRNLINNAIKFTPEDGLIEITANQIEDQISICVKDSGIGISKEDARNLFRIDSTVKRKGTNNEDGSGLGLILCKEFVAKNNGTIWVNTSLGEGSSFFFTVPAKIGKSHQSIENDSSQQFS